MQIYLSDFLYEFKFQPGCQKNYDGFWKTNNIKTLSNEQGKIKCEIKEVGEYAVVLVPKEKDIAKDQGEF